MSDELPNYQASIYSELFFTTETDVVVNGNIRIVMLEQLLNDTTKHKANPLIICNPVKMHMKQSNVLILYSYDIVQSDKIEDDFEAIMIQTLFEKPSIISSDREPRIEFEYLKKTNINTFSTLFENTANHVIENETQFARYGFDTIKIARRLCTQTCFSCS